MIKGKGEFPSRISITDIRHVSAHGGIDLAEIGENGHPIWMFKLVNDPLALLDASWEYYGDRMKAIGIASKSDLEELFDEDVCVELREKLLGALRGFFPWGTTSFTMNQAFQSGSSKLQEALESNASEE